MKIMFFAEKQGMANYLILQKYPIWPLVLKIICKVWEFFTFPVIKDLIIDELIFFQFMLSKLW